MRLKRGNGMRAVSFSNATHEVGKYHIISLPNSLRHILQGFDERLFLWCLSVPELLGGKQLSSSVIDLSPWVEYEFRVLATNGIGTGEPSKPSKKARTKEMRTYQKLLTFPPLPTVAQIVCKSCPGRQLDPSKELYCTSAFQRILCFFRAHSTGIN